MDPTAQDYLNRSVMILKTLCSSLCENTVNVQTLEFIISKKEVFLEVVKVLENCRNESLPLITSEFENLLSCRDKDLRSLEEVVRTVEKLQFLFKEISESKIFTSLHVLHIFWFFFKICSIFIIIVLSAIIMYLMYA